MPDQIRLLLRFAFVYPLKLVVDGRDCAVWPDRPEEWSVRDFLSSGIDWRSSILRPVRAPSPAHSVGVQGVALEVEQGDLSRRRDVVALERQIADGVGQGIRHAQRCNEVVDTPVL